MNQEKLTNIIIMWLTRLGHYFITLVLLTTFVAFVILLIPELHNLWTNDIYSHYNTTQLNEMGFFDNERYLLSALVQSLAATIALVITLTLVALQLAAQSYSPRVMKVYKNYPDMWILLGIFIVTIFYGLGLIKIVQLGVLGNYMEDAIFGAYFMGLFTFVCLIPYVRTTLDLLTPSKVVELLAKEITIEDLLKQNHKKDTLEENDALQPIIDIIDSSLDRNDYETVRNGLNSISMYVSPFIDKDLSATKKERISTLLVNHVSRIGKKAAEKDNWEAMLFTIYTLKDIGIKLIDNRLKTENCISELNSQSVSLSKNVLGRYNSYIVEDIIENLEDFITRCIKCNLLEESKKPLQTLKYITQDVAKKGKYQEIKKSMEAIISVYYELTISSNDISPIIQALQEIEDKTISRELDEFSKECAEIIGKIAAKDAEIFEQRALHLIVALGNMGKKACNYKTLDGTIKTIAESLENIASNALKNDKKEIISKCVLQLQDIKNKLPSDNDNVEKINQIIAKYNS